MEIQKPYRRGLAVPLLLIALGIGFLLSNLGLLPHDFWGILSAYWPALFIVFGLDSLYKGEGVVGPLQGIGIGIVFLLSNLGFLNLDIWGIIVRFWPLLIISAGLDVILGQRGQRTIWGWLVGLGFLAVFLGSVFWFSGTNTTYGSGYAQEEFSQNLDGVDAYELKVHNIAGGVHLSASSSTNAALAGTVFIRPSENIEVLKTGSGDDVQIELKTVGTTIITPFDTSTNTARWEIGIHPDIPAELDLELIFGNLSVDLRGTQVSDFVVETIFGNKDITLSDLPGTEGRLSGIVGKTTLTIPENLSVKVRIDDGIVTTVYPDEFTRNGDWVYSPGAENDPDAMEFRISQLVGRVVLESENE